MSTKTTDNMTKLHNAGYRLMIGYIQTSAVQRLQLGMPDTIFPVRSTSGTVPVYIDPTRSGHLKYEQRIAIKYAARLLQADGWISLPKELLSILDGQAQQHLELPAWFDKFLTNVCEIHDRNSPDDEPDAIVATLEELRSCAMSAIEQCDSGEVAQSTSSMTLAERIAYVGGRVTEAGHVEFGSPMAVDALIQHVLRDVHTKLCTDAQVTPKI